MNPARIAVRAGCLVAGLAAVMFCASCGPATRGDPVRPLPDAAQARRAVESALEAWRASPELASTSHPSSNIVFVDQRRRLGQPLRAFTILRESPAEGFRRFQVKLSLSDPDESRVASYCVFGVEPIWVYRSEDFDMIMHWECPAPEKPQPGAEAKAQ